MKVCAKIYYEKMTGVVITVTCESTGCTEETTKEQDMELYPELKGKSIDEIDYIELEYGTLMATFNNAKSYLVDTLTKTLKVTHYSEEELAERNKVFENEQIIQERINTITEYATLDNNSIEFLENAILEIEKNKILEGMM